MTEEAKLAELGSVLSSFTYAEMMALVGVLNTKISDEGGLELDESTLAAALSSLGAQMVHEFGDPA